MSHVVVIGAGQAGASLVSKLRKGGFEGRITLIGDEPVPPYQRPPLSKKYLLGEMALERLFLKPESYYAENDITLRLGERVEAVDTKAQTIRIGDENIAYDELVLATGVETHRVPSEQGGDLAGVHVVHDLKDVEGLAPEFVEGRQALILGGGYIGLEAAAVAAMRGLNVTLVHRSERILRRVAAQETSDWFRALHQSHGVEILEDVQLETLTGKGRVRGARLSNGREIAVDFVIAGIGISPATALAEAAGIEIDNGIKVDARGRTSVPHVWAAGDCASFPYRGVRIRLESVPNAIEQAECVAENIMGADKPYIAKPWFWSDQYDVKLQIAGLNTGYDQVVLRKSGAASVSHWYYRGHELLAVDAMNAPRDYMAGKRMIETGISPAPEAIADPDSDLKVLMRG